MKICTKCGARMSDSNRFCEKCGSTLVTAATSCADKPSCPRAINHCTIASGNPVIAAGRVTVSA